MASCTSPFHSELAVLAKPSSWPIRRERQRIASHDFSRAVMKELADIKDAVGSFETVAPPGLGPWNRVELFEDFTSAMKGMMSSHAASITSAMERLVADHAEYQALVEARLGSLETLVVCGPTFSPSVDEVLNKLADIRSHAQPVPECSPCKVFSPCISVAPNSPQVQLYDIGESRKNACVQTNTMPKLRKHRCHGRASQTEPSNKTDLPLHDMQASAPVFPNEGQWESLPSVSTGIEGEIVKHENIGARSEIEKDEGDIEENPEVEEGSTDLPMKLNSAHDSKWPPQASLEAFTARAIDQILSKQETRMDEFCEKMRDEFSLR